ncbi:hypothetical protein C6497_16875 [Candidatus Poribacteria bacterium]|nr:MAG: hypothetical protein C6497_16875 [Candidatus Poribacteria bacterium]
MKICHIANKGTTCNISVPETEENNKDISQIAYCKQCSHIAFQCSSGHWNVAFARFCTQCGQELQKPRNWEMASANPQRTATQPDNSKVSLDIKNGFGSWAAGIPEIEPHEDLPKLLAFDGLIVIPNTNSKSLDAYSIVNPENNRHLKQQWSIELNTPLTQGSTPIYHGLHLYTVVSGGIQKTNVLDGKTEFVNIKGTPIDASQIEPLPGCAPLKCNIKGSSKMVAGLKQGVLVLDLNSYDGVYIEKSSFVKENRMMAPTLCGIHVVFTSQSGQIFTLNIGEKPYKSRLSTWQGILFSTPITLGNLVYFEALYINGKRKLISYEPKSDNLLKVADLESDQDFKRRRSLFFHPTLADGERIFLSDSYGETVYTYYINKRRMILNRLTVNGPYKPVFAPHRSVVMNNRIFSAHQFGFTILDLNLDYQVSHQSLAMGQNNNPFPLSPPIQYGQNLFLLCRERVVCLNY